MKIKYAFLILFSSLFIGVSVGVVNTIFGRVLLFIGEFRSHYFLWLIPFLGVVGLVIIWFYHRLGLSLQKGMGLVLATGRKENNHIPLRLVPLVAISTWLTHLFGGSAGREGVAVQIGATLSHQIGKRFKLEDSSQIFLVIGIAAGFAGLFQTPLAAFFFAFEVLKLYKPKWWMTLPALIAALTASQTSHLLGLEKFTHPLDFVTISSQQWLALLLLGIAFGYIGRMFIFLLKKSKFYLEKWVPNPFLKIFLGGIGLSILMILLFQGRYAGLGTNLIDASLNSQEVLAYDWLLKIILTCLTLAIGFQGGEVTPLFAIGASAGVIMAQFLGLPLALAAGLGYMAVFGSATNTLIAPIFIACEVFGYQYILLYAPVMVIAHLCNRKASIYQ
ncbi:MULTISPECIES: chloride channel protein [unclassified Streptococcus]|uniref:chloride channel protein n=1 Tax=unclassified Streptococcus TaxID=2608887 RepID=UPI000A7C8B16|nr:MULTISPECIES: chloride channel protein [unclassified Streptococcus]